MTAPTYGDCYWIGLGSFAAGALIGWGIHPDVYEPPADKVPAIVVERDPGCQEDEAAIVAEDRDPAHGLTWVCVNLEELVNK